MMLPVSQMEYCVSRKEDLFARKGDLFFLGGGVENRLLLWENQVRHSGTTGYFTLATGYPFGNSKIETYVLVSITVVK